MPKFAVTFVAFDRKDNEVTYVYTCSTPERATESGKMCARANGYNPAWHVRTVELDKRSKALSVSA